MYYLNIYISDEYNRLHSSGSTSKNTVSKIFIRFVREKLRCLIDRLSDLFEENINISSA